MTTFASTTTRLPVLRSSANGTSFRFKDSQSLWPMYSPLKGAEWGSMVSRLHLRGMDILMADPTVTAVTVLEVR